MKTISGISKSTMSKIFRFTFRDDFFECKLDPKVGHFIGFIGEHADQEKIDDFIKYWEGEGITVQVLSVKDSKRPTAD